jgi:hypothetical protein
MRIKGMKIFKWKSALFLKIILIFIVIGFILGLLSYVAVSSFISSFNSLDEKSLTSKLQTFKSQLGNFSISYPEVLQAADLPGGNHGDIEVITSISNARSSPDIKISRKLIESGALFDLWNWGQKRAASSGEFQDLGIKENTTSKNFGVSFEYRKSFDFPLGKINYHCIDWYYMNDKNNNGYDFAFCIDEKYWDQAKIVFQDMIESITFNP